MMRRALRISALALVALVVGLTTLHVAMLDGLTGLLLSSFSHDDSVYAAGYTDGGFRRIRAGMTGPQVLAILGKPTTVWTDPFALAVAPGGTEFWAYSHSPSGGNYRIRLVYLRDGVVQGTRAEYWVD